ncbi:hypothetical protein COMA2_110044 [Candidatus Nitrospira nitrificans]|uniref:Uncharacterized protein n=1 Tax=Candidatus Nitrospira nitrificans TaxID=1742973 RepID=A0A0S4L598_9BACT|nr:hypothetical protein COMA2_110044 [Candidatus Nitrospira nitrificans]
MCMKWLRTVLIAVCWWSGPLDGWAEPLFSIPRPSSATEKQLHEESLYLKEETVSIASRYEQPISKAPSDVYVITDEDIRKLRGNRYPDSAAASPWHGSHANERGRFQRQCARK